MKAGETSVQQKDLAEPLSLEISSASQHTACARLGSHLEKVIPRLRPQETARQAGSQNDLGSGYGLLHYPLWSLWVVMD